MCHRRLKKQMVRFLCVLGVAVIATHRVSAQDLPLANVLNVGQQTLDKTLDYPVDHTDLDLSVSWPAETKLQHANALRLPKSHSQVASFVKKCADLKAIPLIEITAQEDKHVFFGIQFEGYMGIYARM